MHGVPAIFYTHLSSTDKLRYWERKRNPCAKHSYLSLEDSAFVRVKS